MPPIDERNQQQVIQLAPGALQLFEEVSQRYDAEIAQGVAPEELLKPAFWAHRAARLRPLDEIRARAVDGTWMAEYVVLDCSRTWARVQLKGFWRLTTADVAATQASEEDVKAFIAAHDVRYRGGQKYSIVRLSDGAVLEQGIADKVEASRRLEELARVHVGGAAAPKPSAVAAPV
jgi:hypothetical protein